MNIVANWYRCKSLIWVWVLSGLLQGCVVEGQIDLPGRLEAEQYYEFYDTTPGNTGGQFRQDDVDIGVASDAGGGHYVGWTDNGEYLRFNILVAQAGNYTLGIRAATIKPGRQLTVRVLGTDHVVQVAIPNSGGWQNWQTTQAALDLPAGLHKLEVLFDTEEINLNYIDFQLAGQPEPEPEPEPGDPGWKLIWSDEFNGSSIDLTKWEHEVNAWGGGNNELQYYTARPENSYIENGRLVIKARKESYSGPEGHRDYTSARLRTLNKGDFLYGKIEVRAKLPAGKGLWPAIWMLPTDWVYGGWAASGEIDIMEAVNLQAGGGNKVYGTLHYGGPWPDNTHTGDSYTPATSVVDNFHTYSIEWEPNEIRWYVDGVHYQTQTQWWSTGGDYPAPFNQKFHIILNVAVGGNWPGSPDHTTSFPQTMEVDYVRVYQRDSGSGDNGGGTDQCDSSPYGGSPLSIPGRLEAENYDNGCNQVSYYDIDSGNEGNRYRQDDVDIERAVDSGGGYALGWTRDGEWLNYTVRVRNSGRYDFHLRTASKGNGSSIRFSIDDNDVTDSIYLPHTGGWQNWQTVTARNIELPAGVHTLRLNVEDGDFNLNYIDIQEHQSGPHTVDKSRGEWTLVVIPDTQHYSQNRSNAPIAHMHAAFDWLVQVKDDLNIKFVQGLGDITESWNNSWEWDNATGAWYKLYGQMPFMPIIGNHDDPWTMNRYFPVSSFSNEPWWGGDFGSVENNYALMTIGKENYLFLQVETYDQYSDYRPAGIEWAKGILSRYPDRKVILATHDNWATQHIRNQLLYRYDNIVLSNAGHVCDREVHYVTNGPRGGVSNNFIVDYQCDPQEVMLIRYYVFKPLEDRVDYFTYSPVTNQFEVDASSQGSFHLIQKDP